MCAILFIACVFIFLFIVLFFFKQKTAYEMRISDWSSDVCSSDLVRHIAPFGRSYRLSDVSRGSTCRKPCDDIPRMLCNLQPAKWGETDRKRSEEHTSELQSLMRISYAVFCLKKKKTNHNDLISHNTHIRTLNISKYISLHSMLYRTI